MARPIELKRALGSLDASALVVGTVIGTGVFLKTAPMSQALGSPLLVLLAWLAAGVLSLLGALVYAELGGMFPEAGGEFVFLKKGYGKGIAFLYGWQRFWIGGPGSIAAYAVGAATFALGILPLSALGQKLLAIGFIAVFTGLNCLAVTLGGRIQTALTLLKGFLVAGLAVAAFAFSRSGAWTHLSQVDGSVHATWSAFGVAMISALWAFDGWNNLPMAAGEVRNPEKNLPIALTAGTVAVLAIYCMANIGYFYSLPFAEITAPGELSVAARAAETFLGSSGVTLLSVAFVISAVGAMHGSILTSARVPYAMAREKLAPEFIGRVHRSTQVPVRSVLVQGAWACVLALSGTFDMLTDWVIFSAWIFYALCGFAVILLRRRNPELARPYRVPFYPVLPALFTLAALALIVNSVIELPRQSLFGLIFIAAGLPVYAFISRRR